MRRPPPRRPRRVAGALIVAAGAGAVPGCADDGPVAGSGPRVVAVAAQPCDRPLPSEGLGVVVADGVVVTAGHVVDGTRRRVTVDGADATVLGIDARVDLAVLRADVTGGAAITTSPDGALHVATPGGEIPAAVVRTGLLVVHDTTDRARYERQAHTIRPAVPAGTSGAPLVDASGDVAGIVVLANRDDGTSYAVTGEEIRRLLDDSGAGSADVRAADPIRDAPVSCPG